MARLDFSRSLARVIVIGLPLLVVAQWAAPGVAQTDAAPRGLTTRPTSQAPAMGGRPGNAPSETQCTNLLAQAEKVPALRESPDYVYCKSRSR